MIDPSFFRSSLLYTLKLHREDYKAEFLYPTSKCAHDSNLDKSHHVSLLQKPLQGKSSEGSYKPGCSASMGIMRMYVPELVCWSFVLQVDCMPASKYCTIKWKNLCCEFELQSFAFDLELLGNLSRLKQSV